ncbi:unnamed protein product [Cochlearia groenlandica]
MPPRGKRLRPGSPPGQMHFTPNAASSSSQTNATASSSQTPASFPPGAIGLAISSPDGSATNVHVANNRTPNILVVNGRAAMILEGSHQYSSQEKPTSPPPNEA